MKNLLIIALLTISTVAFAQNDNAIELLKKYNLTTSNVLSMIDLSEAPYSYKSKISTHTFSKESNTDNTFYQDYTYEASKEIGERFTLTSNDGKTPTKKDIKHFNKSKNASSMSNKTVLKDEDYFVKSNDEKMLIIGFNMPKDELPSKIAYLSHLTGFIHIDKSINKIIKIEFISNEAFSMKIFHINKMIITMDVSYNEDKSVYYITKEATNSDVLMFGIITKSEITEEFSDFKF
ncbi:MAG: hypothetical protein KAG84_07185 [Bacteroidales bacterium]|nr:hypothetical protein [Bacteroidales bacterium]